MEGITGMFVFTGKIVFLLALIQFQKILHFKTSAISATIF